ncbi:hypothetical protein GCM10011375_32480 [Hymenobacter qilianensis]|uniref:Uncharacterized protein n=2 Tax=Hymenobacter qilianensis TaxID=1385715 RepID=A0ACB5PV52_9BACT|nr:AAA-like domain-containing protein [Hymenobacter qilianensis]QNP51469.1 AAA-like domain-containing protein [Hymenobacter qilianensis]GGF74920.1 hypothetical protein GCM10011375_32480 [Hymenobacter qilianensis]
MSQFFTQGPVPISADTYVAREFEQETLAQLFSKNWVLLLGPRQHGKTSALLRIKLNIIEAGIKCAFVDLQKLPPLKSYTELVSWFATEISKELAYSTSSTESYDEVSVALERVVPDGKDPIVIIIDEASGISNDEWRNAFYGQIRAIASRRASSEDGGLPSRLVFAFSGTFRQEKLVDELNSPFNVCQLIETEDITEGQGIEIAEKVLGDKAIDIVNKAFDFVDGQPYLLQKIFATVAQSEETERDKQFEKIKLRFSNGDDPHVVNIFRKVINDEDLRLIVARMISTGQVAYEPANDNFKFLKVIGIAKQSGNKLVFRNKLYSEVASNSPQISESPGLIVSGAHLFELTESSFSFITDNNTREIVYNAHKGAVLAFNVGSYRLSLTGFGCALEGMLIDWLKQQSATDLATAVTNATSSRAGTDRVSFNPPHEIQTDPLTWRFVNLIKVSKFITKTGRVFEPQHALREWRNNIHPSVALRSYIPESDLEPEVIAANSLFEIARRCITS